MHVSGTQTFIGPHIRAWQCLNKKLGPQQTFSEKLQSGAELYISKDPQNSNAITVALRHPNSNFPSVSNRFKTTRLFPNGTCDYFERSAHTSKGFSKYVEKKDLTTGTFYRLTQSRFRRSDGADIEIIKQNTTGPHAMSLVMPATLKEGGTCNTYRMWFNQQNVPTTYEIREVLPLDLKSTSVIDR